VYVKVFVAEDVDHDRLLGVNVPPEPPSDKEIVSVALAVGVTVNFVLALPTKPDDGPVTANDTCVTEYEKGEPVTVALLPLVSVRVLVPADDDGVYVNVLAAEDAVQDRLLGVNVPPADPSEKLMVSVVVDAGVTVKLVLGSLTKPDVGPVRV
jgi:hypothetical protein